MGPWLSHVASHCRASYDLVPLSLPLCWQQVVASGRGIKLHLLERGVSYLWIYSRSIRALWVNECLLLHEHRRKSSTVSSAERWRLKSGNRLYRRALESTADYKGHELSPTSSWNSLSRPHIFGKCFLGRGGGACYLFPWEGCVPPRLICSLHNSWIFHCIVTTTKNQESLHCVEIMNWIQNHSSDAYQSQNWGIFMCVMFFRIWLVIFNLVKILVCLK